MDHVKKRRIVRILLFMMMFSFSLNARAAEVSKDAVKVRASADTTSITLKWTRRSDLTGYKIYSTNSAGKQRKLLQKTASNKLKLENVRQGATYYYRVRGYAKVNGKTVYTKFSTVVSVTVPVPDTRSTLKKLLLTGLQPMGTTLYVYGGGWNEADTGGNDQTTTIGVSPEWEAFFNTQNSSYDYRTTRYQNRKGLDCSGYVGWCIYNIYYKKSGKKSFVMLAQNMTRNFASRGWGTYYAPSAVTSHRAGDIMSLSSGHVYIVVGECSDGSVVLMHSSPPGVQLCGTPSASGKKNSQAVKLATRYMKKYFRTYYNRYPNCYRDSSYLTKYSQMRWDISGASVMSDPDGYSLMSADELLKDLFAAYAAGA